MSRTLDAVREKYPAYREVPDATLARAIAGKYPQYLAADPALQAVIDRADNDAEANRERTLPLRSQAELATVQPQPSTTAGAPQTAGWDSATLLRKVGEGGREAVGTVVTPLAEVMPKLSREEMAGVTGALLSPTGMPGVGPIINPDTPSMAIATGVEHAVADLANFFTSPLGIATMGMGQLPVRAQQVISGAFAADMLRQVPDIAAELWTEIRKPEGERDLEKIANLTTHGLGALGFGGLATRHAMKGPKARATDALRTQLETADLQGQTRGGDPLAPSVLSVPPEQRGGRPTEYVDGMSFNQRAAGVPPAEPSPSPQRAAGVPPAEPSPSPRPQRDWELYAEKLASDLDSFYPARHTGARDYDLVDAAQRFVDFAAQDTTGHPPLDLLKQWGKADEQVTPTQLRKIRESIKQLDDPTPQRAAGVPPAEPSPSPATTRPMDKARGRQADVSTPVAGHKVQAAFDVVELRDLTTSFDAAYDQSIQPRDRLRQASQNQIANIVNKFEPQRLGESATSDLGAPFIDEAGQVLSGNGRTAALRALYQAERSADYKEWLVRNADRFGLQPDAIAALEQPVLVRRVTDYRGISKQEFARQSNQSQLLGQSTGEKAVSDARMLVENPAVLASFRPNEAGDVLAASNREFLNAFIQGTGDSAELVAAGGGYQPALRGRVQNAVLGAVIGPENRSLLNALTERAEDLSIKTQVNALLQSAPTLVKLKGTEYDLSPVLEKALTDLVKVRQSGEKVRDFLDQSDMFGDPTRSLETDLLLMFLADAKSTKSINEFLARYQSYAREGLATASGGDMFGATPPPRAEVLKRAYAKETEGPQAAQEGLPLGKPPATGAQSAEPTRQGAGPGTAPAQVTPPLPPPQRAAGVPPAEPSPPFQGTSAVGFPAAPAAPVPPSPTPPPGPGITMMMDARVPVTLDRTKPGSVSVPEIMRSLESVVRAAGSDAGNIRVRRFFNKARGIWKPNEEIIRLTDADNIPTATHEVGHGLQQLVYGTFRSKGLKFLSPPIRRELIGMGKALYGSRKPVAGYTGEGFAEFMRYWLTTEDAPRVAPNMTAFFEGSFLPTHPEVARSLREARAKLDTWRFQGAEERARRQVMREPGFWRRVAKALGEAVGYEAQMEAGAAIKAASQTAARKRGRPLAPSEDPYLVFKAKRGSAGALTERMATVHMLDVWGNPTGPSLAEGLAPVRGQRQNFLLYLYGRRAVERWGKGQNPGITLEDAQHLVRAFGTPEAQLAAQKYYQWWDGVLDYAAQADPTLADLVTRIRRGSADYAPLARMIDPARARRAAAAAQSNPLFKMHGSGLPVKDIFDQTFIAASRIINRAHQGMVMNRVVQLANIPGMGRIIEEVPLSRVMQRVNIEKLRDQLEAMGVDTSTIPPDEILKFATQADRPRGTDPIVAYKTPTGQTRWFEVDPKLYEALEGLQIYSLKNALPGLPYVGIMLDVFLGVPARTFRLGTTGLRAPFSLVTNPLRDLPALLLQTRSNPAKVAAEYPAAMLDAFTGGKWKQVFYDLGAHMGQPLGIDIGHTQRVSKELFHGRVLRIVKNPVDHLRELLSLPESGPRIAELRAVAEDIGWQPGQPLTPDQAIQLTLAAKEVTVDFSAAGRFSRVLNTSIPFYNAAVQGLRTFARVFQRDPKRAVLLGLGLLTAPTLINWWRNKDKEWYRNLPWRERYLYSNIDDAPNVWRIPRPFEWGNLFMVVPEAIFDSWYQQDPEGVQQAIGHVFKTTNPVDWPVLPKIAKEQWSNRIEFWDRPIIPRSEQDLPPAEQYGPYTSRLARAIGRVFPQVSPRRLDAALHSYAGGTAGDLLDAIGIGAPRSGRESEPADVPVLGVVARRGGQFNSQSQHINDFYDLYLRSRARVEALKVGEAAERKGLRPEGATQQIPQAHRDITRDGERTSREIRMLLLLSNQAPDLDTRQSLYREAAAIAQTSTQQYRLWLGEAD